ncbi:mCG145911, partial [Mus musculus]
NLKIPNQTIKVTLWSMTQRQLMLIQTTLNNGFLNEKDASPLSHEHIIERFLTIRSWLATNKQGSVCRVHTPLELAGSCEQKDQMELSPCCATKRPNHLPLSLPTKQK